MSTRNRDNLVSDDDGFDNLLKSAGRGPRLSDEARTRIRNSVEAAWRKAREDDAGRPEYAEPAKARRRVSTNRSTRGNGWRRRARWLAPAIAASVAAVIAMVLLERPPGVTPNDARTFAAVALFDGSVTVIRDGRQRRLQDTGSEAAFVGERIETSDGARLALRLGNGMQLRLNEETTIEIADSAAVELIAGMIYLDVPPSVPPAEFAVVSAYGTVEHVGTQYSAAVAEDGLVVRVREGEARVLSDAANGTDRAHTAMAGQQIEIGSGGTAEVSDFSRNDPQWAWVEELARTSFDEPRSVLALLEWAARETGRTMQLEPGAARDRAESIVLNQVDGLSPSDLLSVIRSTTDLAITESPTTLTVTFPQ
jgi:ferric-dicitrate binding protein FerR (iron transport regulator)